MNQDHSDLIEAVHVMFGLDQVMIEPGHVYIASEHVIDQMQAVMIEPGEL